VKVAMLTSGVDLSHPRFESHEAKLEAKSFVKDVSRTDDVIGAGTFNAGILTMLAPWADIHVLKIAEVTSLTGTQMEASEEVDWFLLNYLAEENC
jgi:hypothetical protein